MNVRDAIIQRVTQRIMKMRTDNSAYDLTDEVYRLEYLTFPVAAHDDMFDCLSRIVEPELGARFPLIPTSVAAVSGANFFEGAGDDFFV